MKKVSLFLLSFVFLAATSGWGLEKGPAGPGPKTKCPVCGMFVAKYTDFLAKVTFKDSSSDYFDGSKDMFRYLLNLKKYSPRKEQADIGNLQVTDYYSLTLIDGLKAFYVFGSDVYGPMGKELIPFEKEAEARAFMKDHQGKRVLRFQEVSNTLLGSLD
ncbi:MAG TPA: nitrous oxide reductase accessory protein NosL [Syntrophorhabdaceae bacterium]